MEDLRILITLAGVVGAFIMGGFGAYIGVKIGQAEMRRDIAHNTHEIATVKADTKERMDDMNDRVKWLERRERTP
ncbi:MAG: hypothetical protein L0191_09980 [Acidobacteria bacterium]|nr:hypothetical protein [Acidobacteriota bacterium]